MELWIRSQNKKLLIKPKNIGIIQEGNWYDRESPLSSKYKVLYKITNENYFLGEYKTEERALEVLDEIQDHILNLGETVLNYGKEYKTYGRVYEMPKE